MIRLFALATATMLATTGIALGQVSLPPADWTVASVSSEETAAGDYRAINAFDENPATLWTAQWSGPVAQPPHDLVIDLAGTFSVSAVRYLPRQDGSSVGNVADYEIYVSDSLAVWGPAVKFATFMNSAAEQEASFPAKTGRYVRLRVLSEASGLPYVAVAELRVLIAGSAPPDDTITVVSVSSEETAAGDYRAINALDENPSTLWTAQWSGPVAQPPHDLVIDLAGTFAVSAVRYLPRQDGSSVGNIADYEIYVSDSLAVWGPAVKFGTFLNSAAEQEASFPAKTGRYVRLRVLSEVSGLPYVAVAELRVLTAGNATPDSTITAPAGNVTIAPAQSVQFSGAGHHPGGAALTYSWTAAGGTIVGPSDLPVATIRFDAAGVYTVRFTVTADGIADPSPATRTVTVQAGGVPLGLPKAKWTVVSASSEETAAGDYRAINAFDGDPATLWTSQWSGPVVGPPHDLVIKLARISTVSGFRYLPRQDGSSVGNIADYEFYVSDSLSVWGPPVKVGTFLNSATEQEVLFPAKTGRYVRLRVLSEVSGLPYVAVAELAVLGNGVRKGLAVVTDFADRRLEDWTGGGMRNVDDVSLQLRSMEDHWAWLSRGVERIQWDIIRIQLPRPAVPNAYPEGWSVFRDDVARLVRDEVNVADYDLDGDGVIDAAWAIVSNGNIAIDAIIGGSSRNGGVNMFVDGQASESARVGAIGNFNHELGHLSGLGDMYGPYDTVHGLTIMSDSWPVPPQGLTAYERQKLGWVQPRIVRETTHDVWLPSAHDALAAVMIPTDRPHEYFLIEYQKRPASGYGSRNPPFNGLAIYHVLEGSSMAQDPPVLKLEPADGHIVPGAPLNPADFAYPENAAMLRPLVLRSYFGDGREVFRIDNVAWRDGGLAFDIIISDASAPAENLLSNPSFETGQAGRPDAWGTGAWASTGTFVWPGGAAVHGDRSARLETSSPDDMWWGQTVNGLVPGQSYLLCGWMKGEAIQGTNGAIGGNVSLLGSFERSEGLWGTFDWTNSCMKFVAENPTVGVACRLGFYGSTVTGRLWCDGLVLERMRRAF